jgi:hypothetical protein
MLSCNNISSKKLAKRLGMFALGSAAVCLFLITNDKNKKSNVYPKKLA